MKFVLSHLERIAVFALLVIATGVFWTPSTYFAGDRAQLWANDPYSTVFNAVLIAFLAVACLARADAVLPLLRAAWPIAPLLALAYLSAYWSQFPDVVLLHTTKIAAMALFGIYLIARGGVGDLVALFVKVSLVAAAASVAIFIVAPALAFSTNLGYETAWRGAFTDKNELGMVAALGGLFAAYAFRNRYGSRLLSGIAIPINLLLLYLSESRTPLVLLLTGIYVGIVARAFRRHTGMGLVTGFLLTVLGVVGTALSVAFLGDLLAALGRNPTLSDRTQIWGTVIPFIEQRPWLGYGLDSFWLPEGHEANIVWAVLNWKAPSAHNLWL
jgi:exopolysaccharide production protein ExoQ